MLVLSWKGAVVVLLILLPNLIFLVLPPRNAPEAMKDGGLLVNVLEHSARMLFIAVLMLTTKDKQGLCASPLFIGMCFCLIAYYGLWIRYAVGGGEFSLLSARILGIPAPMAVFPILYMLFAALWFSSVPALVSAGLFAIGHMINLSIGFGTADAHPDAVSRNDCANGEERSE